MSNIYLNDQNVDDLGRMVVALLSELWIMRDRMAVTEALLARSNALNTADIESFTYTPEMAAEMEALRDRVVASVVGAPVNAANRSIDQILRRAGFLVPDVAPDSPDAI